MTQICFLYQTPHKCHKVWAESIHADFIYFTKLPQVGQKYDVLLIEGGLPLWAAWKYKKKHKKTKLIYLNADETVLIWKKRLLTGPIYFTKWRYALSRIDSAISVSNLVSIKRNLRLKIPEVIVRPFIEYKYNKPRYNPENKAIITVGYYHPKQGINILIKAFKLLKKQNEFKDLKLYLVGKGYPKKLVQKDIMLTGFVKDLEKIYRLAQLYVHAGRYQAHPIAPLEAMHYGIPTIVTNKTGVYEVLRPELVSKCNPKDLAQRIEWFLDLDDVEKKKYSRYCYNKSLEFLEDKNIEKFIRAFEKLIEDK